VAVEILVFDGNKGVAEDIRVVVIGGDDAALQGKGADDTALSVVEFGDRTGTVAFELFDLGRSVE